MPNRRSIGDESREFGRARPVTKLHERLRLDLTNSLASHAEFLPDLFQGMIRRPADAETHAKDALLPRSKIGKRFNDHSP